MSLRKYRPAVAANVCFGSLIRRVNAADVYIGDVNTNMPYMFVDILTYVNYNAIIPSVVMETVLLI